MADGEAPHLEVEVPPSESPDGSSPDVSPGVSPDVSPDISPDISPGVSPDVAPTRRARRRPEPKPVAQQDQSAKPEEQPAAVTEHIHNTTSSVSTVSVGGWGSWSSWGRSLLSTATATVATVGQGLTQVVEKAETSLGIPSPSQLSAQVEEERQEEVEQEQQTDCRPVVDGIGVADGAVGGAMGMLSSLSSVVQSTGKTVITGGLDALEFIGKKTMDVIAEGDPGFRKTKGLMIRNGTLSQVLREAKEREELQAAAPGEPRSDRKAAAAHYGVLFDEFQGLWHLEALETLSRDSESKVKSVLSTLSGEKLLQLKLDLDRIRDGFSLVDLDEEDEDEDQKTDADGAKFEKQLLEALEELRISAPGPAHKLSTAWNSSCSRITHMSNLEDGDHPEDGDQPLSTHSVDEVHAAAIRSLAELTARSIELFHKLAQMILFSSSSVAVDATPPPSAPSPAAVLSRLTVLLCKEMSLMSRKFTDCLTAAGSSEKGDVLNPLITGVFLEASNSASYVQDAFQLLRPVLQLAHIQRLSCPRDP